jgi:hypothetical protein
VRMPGANGKTVSDDKTTSRSILEPGPVRPHTKMGRLSSHAPAFSTMHSCG